jgi:hypothetical protein
VRERVKKACLGNSLINRLIQDSKASWDTTCSKEHFLAHAITI